MLTPEKTIVPFLPRPFPPRKLDRQFFSAELHKANHALADYAKELAYQTAILPPSVFSSLFATEALASLHSQQLKLTLKEALQLSKKSSKLKPVIHYIQALQWACKKIQSEEIDKKFILALHQKIKTGISTKREIGSYRKRQNWIGPARCTISQAYFYPPAPRHVSNLMQELARYSRQQSLQPLLQLALSFAQLLVIHPFMDGNGRIARILIPLFLYRKKHLPAPLFFMSSYFKRHRLHYVRTLYQITEEGRWEPWILFFLKGMSQEAVKEQKRLKKISLLYQTLQQEGLDIKLLHFLFTHPVFSRAALRGKKNTKPFLSHLLHKKWLYQDQKGRFVFTPLFKLLKNS